MSKARARKPSSTETVQFKIESLEQFQILLLILEEQSYTPRLKSENHGFVIYSCKSKKFPHSKKAMHIRIDCLVGSCCALLLYLPLWKGWNFQDCPVVILEYRASSRCWYLNSKIGDPRIKNSDMQQESERRDLVKHLLTFLEGEPPAQVWL